MTVELLITGASLLTQLSACALGIRFIRRTGRRAAGLLIIATIFLMAFRRAISLFRVIAGGPVKIDLFAEIVALVISLMILVGVLYLTGLGLKVKAAAAELRSSEQRLADITSSLGEGIYVLDERGRVDYVNPEAEHLLGWTREELLGRNMHDLVHHRRADGTPLPVDGCPVINVIQTGRRFISEEEVFVRRDGTVFPVSVISTPVVRDGKITAAVAAFRDISDKKLMEEEILKLLKLESAGVFAGGIAHDFNNLLQTIMTNVSLAKMLATDSPRLSGYLDTAEGAAEQARALSHRLLTLAMEGEPVTRLTSIVELLDAALDLALDGSNVAPELHVASDTRDVRVDPEQIKQVFSNILLNAREAMPAGGTIRISCANTAEGADDGVPLPPGPHVRISITDEGRGIPAEDLPRIFDPYFSSKDLSTTRGRGLGLSVSHSIVRKHRGTILAESLQGVGATFHVYLPAA